MSRFVIGITGGSGIIYGLRLVEVLSSSGHEVHVILSEEAKLVSADECLSEDKLVGLLRKIASSVYGEHDFTAPIASSSYLVDGTIVIPCTLKTLGEIANSIQSTLISRAALNSLRLRRPLVLVVRETPLSTLDIINMLKISLSGGVVMPASPAFYIKPQSIQDLVDFIVGKVLDVLGLENNLYKRWEGLKSTQGTSLCARFYELIDS
ncbi:MAG: UbiX family flavin prenyltransferase [Desulfurococcaceae archaeon TW002]